MKTLNYISFCVVVILVLCLVSLSGSDHSTSSKTSSASGVSDTAGSDNKPRVYREGSMNGNGTGGSTPPKEHESQGMKHKTGESSTANSITKVDLKAATEDSQEMPDGLAIQRTFLVLAGLGTIIIAYFAIKFACVKKRRRERNNTTSRYGLVETSEMDLLENEEQEEEEEDDTLFDLHSHRRT